jgi:hypothetical protein
MPTIKEKVLQVTESLPKDAEYDDIMEMVYVLQKIAKDIRQLDNGESVTHEQERMKKRLI